MTSTSTSTEPRRRTRGFSLVEILAVVAVIAILTALLLPAVANLLDKAEQSKTRTEVNLIATAINRYFQETGDLPVSGDHGGCQSGWIDRERANNNQRRTELRRLEYLYQQLTIPASNRVHKVFLEFPLTPVEDDWGVEYLVAVDPYGNPYMVIMDCTGNNAIGASRGIPAIVRSLGKDGRLQDDNVAGKDDISSRH